MKGTLGLTLFLFLGRVMVGEVSWAANCQPIQSGVTAPSHTDVIKLSPEAAGASPCTSCVNAAKNAWNSACASHENPALQTAGSADFEVDILFVGGANTWCGDPGARGCGCTTMSIQGGEIVSGTMWIFEAQENGVSCSGSTTNVIRHEIGHVLGLDDPPSGTCSNRIMGNVNGSLGSLECTAVDNNWMTDAEQPPPPPGPPNHPCVNPPA